MYSYKKEHSQNVSENLWEEIVRIGYIVVKSLFPNLPSDPMKLFPSDTFLVYKTRLKGDIFFIMYWDLDCYGKPDCIQQFIRIDKMDQLPLKTPLLIIRPPVIKGIYDKRELSFIITEEVERKRAYLDRMWEKLWHQLKTLILTNKLYYKPKSEPDEKQGVSDKIRKLLFLIELFLGGDDWKDGEWEKKKPP